MGTAQSGSAVTDLRIAGTNANSTETSIFSPRNFLIATRDSGYRSTSSALSEFVDNSIQANASNIYIQIRKEAIGPHPIEISVSDDGDGMSESQLSQALAFGGSARFGDRSSLGRYGMGLPNAALSQARRIDVYSWTSSNSALRCSLDLDELATADEATIGAPIVTHHPPDAPSSPHGTVVHLQRCDRLQHRRPSTVAKKLTKALGRTYRHFLQDGLVITVNGEPVSPEDPLFLNVDHDHHATVFGAPLVYNLASSAGTGTIEVTFTELPVEAWSGLTAQVKRNMGITNGATVSVVRAGREIDSGWWFMGKKRRQNYDDWWRCEIAFDPELDEMFGITHCKQQVTPGRDLAALLSNDIEPIANALNARVRKRFELASSKGPLADAARTAAIRSLSLPQLAGSGTQSVPTYRFDVGPVAGTSAFTIDRENQDLAITLNERHPFYRDVLRPLTESSAIDQRRTAQGIALVVLAMARSEAALAHQAERSRAEQFRGSWSDVAATFLNA